MKNTEEFKKQFSTSQESYLSELDFFTWTRHFHIIKTLLKITQGEVLEAGTGDGVVRRCIQPFVKKYTVLDINPALHPDILGNIRECLPNLVESFDAVVVTEVLEHLPFSEFPHCLSNFWKYLRPGGFLLLTLPHRKGHMLIVTPGQKLWKLRFPIGLTSLSEAYNRFVRRQIWIDPNHYWEIGDGVIQPSNIDDPIRQQGWKIQNFERLPYCDYWLLRKPSTQENLK